MIITLEIFGVKAVRERFDRIKLRAADTRAAGEVVLDILREATAKNMQSGGRRGGGSWSALKYDTLLRKFTAGEDLRPEFATGALYRSLTAPDDPNQLAETRGQTVVFGSKLPYGKFQQHGTRHMPARRLVKLTTTDRKAIAQVYLDWVVG